MWSKKFHSSLKIARINFQRLYLSDLCQKQPIHNANPKIKEILRVAHANWQAYVNFERGCNLNLEKMNKLEEIDEQLLLLLDKYDVKESDIVFIRSNTTYTSGVILSKICKPTTELISTLMKEFSSTFFDNSLREALKIGECDYRDVCQILKEMRDVNTTEESKDVLSSYPFFKQLFYRGYSLVSKIHVNL